MRGLSATVALAACLVAVGCGARSQPADQGGVDAPGVLVFSGMTSGSYLHAIRPDGSDLRSFALPKTCSPESFTSGGAVLVCIDLGGDDDLENGWEYAVERTASGWHRVPLPAEWRFPEWAEPFADPDYLFIARQWSPARNRIAYVRPSDVGSTGEVVVAEADGSNQLVVAADGEEPEWSPDGERLAFSRCRVQEREDEFADERAECSLWTVAVDGSQQPELLIKRAHSDAVWSPDGRFIAFLRQSGSCETFCRYRTIIVPSSGGDPHALGPELVEPTDRTGWWTGLAWLPGHAPATFDVERADELELQRCVEIWNRARMHPWPTGAVNVSLVGGLCQVTVSDYGALCSQTEEMEFRFSCPSHGAGLHLLPPEYRVWNAHGDREGKISLFEEPKGSRLPLPKAPPYPLLDGYVVPFGKHGEPVPDLKLTETTGSCERTGDADTYPLAYPDRYPVRCAWDDSGSDSCFKQPGRLEVGDVVLCPDSAWMQPYDPMHFFRVEVSKFW